jgi:hypothetical protein
MLTVVEGVGWGYYTLIFLEGKDLHKLQSQVSKLWTLETWYGLSRQTTKTIALFYTGFWGKLWIKTIALKSYRFLRHSGSKQLLLNHTSFWSKTPDQNNCSWIIQVFGAKLRIKTIALESYKFLEQNSGSKQLLLNHTHFSRQTLDQTIALGYADSSLAQVRSVCSVTGGVTKGV